MSIRTSILSLLIVTFSISTAGAAVMEEGDPRHGIKMYWKHCQTCHPKGPDFGPVSAESKTQKQWLRYFKRNRHKGSQEAWNAIPEPALVDIKRYLHDNAADSNAVKCGSCWTR